MDTFTETLPITSYSSSQLLQLMKTYEQPAFRAGQLVEWLYQRGATSFDQMTNLPLTLRTQLKEKNPLVIPKIVNKQTSHDGTRKYLLMLQDGHLVETVGIPSKDNRLTVCFSTQVGCAMGCVFCATGQEGFTRNLSVGEIIQQVLVVQNDFQKRVTNLVGMGQGEPFLNYENVMSALEIINSKKGLNIGARKITLSTCGIIASIRKFTQVKEQYTLAISLHSARQSVRDYLMPHAATNTLVDLHQALIDYGTASNRRFTLEYTLIQGINDQEEDLQSLLHFADGLLCHVNLIKLNDIPNSPFKPSCMKTMDLWKHTLEMQGIETTIRISKGSDIAGACGQLKNNS